VDERNVNIIQQLKITLDQNVDMLSFNSAIGIKLLEFIAKYKDFKNNRILIDILDIYKNYDEVAYNNKLFEVGKEAQSRIRDFQLSNIKINRNKSCVMDMDKEMRPMSRGRSSCGNRDNQSLNSTTRSNIINLNNTQGLQHEVNVLKFGDDPLDKED